MSKTPPNSWEPDPNRVGDWRSMFETKGGAGRPEAPAVPVAPEPDDADGDASVYRPWTLQRGSGHPPMMLELRRYELRSGLWRGWQLSYPTLIAVEYLGDRLLTLDFSTRQFAIEGQGLDELARHLRQGSVVAVQEFAAAIWSGTFDRTIVATIRELVPEPKR